MLGHEISFSYCRTTHNDKLCKKIRDCWFDKIDIDGFLKEHYGQDQIQKITQPSGHKYVSLFSLIEQAKKAKEENQSEK